MFMKLTVGEWLDNGCYCFRRASMVRSPHPPMVQGDTPMIPLPQKMCPGRYANGSPTHQMCPVIRQWFPQMVH